MSRSKLDAHLGKGELVRVWHNIYALTPPDTVGQLAGLDLMTGKSIVSCMATAAQLYGFVSTASSRKVSHFKAIRAFHVPLTPLWPHLAEKKLDSGKWRPTTSSLEPDRRGRS